MIVNERRQRILNELRASGAASVPELAETLGVSASTIRRDLEILDRNGELTRSYGGAVLRSGMTVQEGPESPETPYDDSADIDLKVRVAKAALPYVQDGSVVLLDIGTTTPFLARMLRGRDITVVTSNLAVFDELRNDSSVRVVLLGGVLRRNMRTLVGSITAASLQQISADVMFLSCTGVRAGGAIVDDMAVETPLKQAMIASSDKVVLLASEAKFPGTGALRVCELSDVDVLVTTDGAPAEAIEMCRASGGEVVIA
ncbi:DeoR/GlpR family DNA-binding transcription regulator [Leifsonia shinshuensis]|uniref:DeoR/GlpR family DNA-binding transcription regulator n=1 Tax=Leifsonia TaxID=110932 RepID=UPI00286338FA|nr:DeoR/GlpR family DNA-binding transcription regulator [Leifsonia shinshuensis]MDR6971632.1 DeoR/GlpR family transcriptional regulator of sugar metabolism [Leifsonia shinshuensis]